MGGKGRRGERAGDSGRRQTETERGEIEREAERKVHGRQRGGKSCRVPTQEESSSSLDPAALAAAAASSGQSGSRGDPPRVRAPVAGAVASDPHSSTKGLSL